MPPINRTYKRGDFIEGGTHSAAVKVGHVIYGQAPPPRKPTSRRSRYRAWQRSRSGSPPRRSGSTRSPPR